MALLLSLGLSLGLFVGGACQSVPGASKSEPKPTWVEDVLEAPTVRVLWEFCVQSLRELNYPIGAGLDPAALVAESGWRTHLAPFRGKGYRVQAEVQLVPEARGLYQVKVRVRRQANMSLVNPTDPSYAEWEWEADDEGLAAILMHQIRSHLKSERRLSDS